MTATNWPGAFSDMVAFICIAAVWIVIIKSGRDE